MLAHKGAGARGVAGQNGLHQLAVLLALGLQRRFGEHRLLQPEVTVAFGLIEQRGAHLQQVQGAAAGCDGGVEGLVPGIPEAEHVLRPLHFHHLGQGVGAGQHLGLPGIVAALDGQGHQHGLQVGAGIVDVLQLGQGHGRHPIALLVHRHHQVLGHQLRQRLAQRPDTEAVAFLEPAHQQLLTGLEMATDDVALEHGVAGVDRVVLGGG